MRLIDADKLLEQLKEDAALYTGTDISDDPVSQGELDGIQTAIARVTNADSVLIEQYGWMNIPRSYEHVYVTNDDFGRFCRDHGINPINAGCLVNLVDED